MSYPVLARRDSALDDAETVALLRDRLGDVVVADSAEFGELTVEVSPAGWHAAAAACRDEDLLSFDLFDCLFGVDAAEAGFDVVAVLYSTSRGRRIMLRTRCEGGREAPVLDTITDLYPGANWMERETFDMFGIDFDGHPGLLPRILCVENFEGWPLRKEFPLASRVAKPWPGVKEPAETDEDGNVIVREPAIGEAAGPSGLDEIIARQAREANPTPEADQDDADGQAADEPQREEVELDQETYDRLIADGKSERIARSKAKAAFIKKQRAAEAAGEDADPSEDPATDVAATDVDDAPAPAAPEADAGDGTEGRTAGQAAPPPGSGDGDPLDGDGVRDQDDDGDAGEDAATSSSAAAESTRSDQVAAREARAAEQADEAARVDDDVEPIPAGTPPPDPDASADETGDESDDEAVDEDREVVDEEEERDEEEEQEEPGEEQEPDEGPYGPGSAHPREDGSGPDGHPVKATTDGNVFVTQDSHQWRSTRADAWFVDEDAARAAGFEHWDPYLRTDLDPPASTAAAEDADELALDDGPPPVGGSLDVPDPRETTTVDVDAADGPDVPGYGALDAHERTPGGVPADQPGPDEPSPDEPEDDEPADDEPEDDEPADDEPADDEPADDEEQDA
ncbi:NADH-quinone oxidoreductase subunit C [Salsipaludibacter albus]|uniref:NADH-quinone oxidoreductase subunit C n=1 Tax=Salsipaludibacter albus TaxID=2849650 RepID=UPI001EE3A3B5|nr:NADH-quinone oxidoreductase subunit C [Salsipaludibacter albus]MBY5161031.1 NADH-quinone oxidoreductase subunit C [Salsipaludibacter albus]